MVPSPRTVAATRPIRILLTATLLAAGAAGAQLVVHTLTQPNHQQVVAIDKWPR